jgi:phytoene synthase
MSEEEIERAEVVRAARDLAYDDYLVALLAPREHQAGLLTLAALFGELARIPLHVTDATLGEIRLQWWRDAFAAKARSGHPVADAALALEPRLPAPLSELMAPVFEAHAAELYAEPFPTNDAFDAYATAPGNASFALRAALLGRPIVSSDPVSVQAAACLGLVRTCARLPFLFAKGRYPVPAGRLQNSGPEDDIDERALRRAMSGLVTDAATAWTALRPQLQRISPDLRRVILPVALAGPYLRAIQKDGRDVLRDVADPSPLERSARLWLAARIGRF